MPAVASSVGLVDEGKQIRRRSFTPFIIIRRRLPPISDLHDDHNVGFSSYYRLPEHLLKLSIIKLDDSSFDVEVGRSATVSDLKLAVEDVFSRGSNTEEATASTISWLHVWSHFCLCYDDQKLINDKAQLRKFGIKDGDQLQFIRHLSIDYCPPKRRTIIKGGRAGVSIKKKDGGDEEMKCSSCKHGNNSRDNWDETKQLLGREAGRFQVSSLLTRMVPWWVCYSRLCCRVRRRRCCRRIGRKESPR